MSGITRMDSLLFILSPSYFFSYSEIIDYCLVPSKPSTLKQSKQLFQSSISDLETLRPSTQYITPSLILFKLLHNQTDGILTVNPQMIKYAANSENLSVIHVIVERLMTNIKSDEVVKIEFEMTIKVLLNVMYVLLRECSQGELEGYHKENDIELLLLRMMKCSLEQSFVPIKKVAIMFLYHLHTKFSPQFTPTQDLIADVSSNIITEDILKSSIAKPPLLLTKDPNVVEAFFAKYNIAECWLAQYIVVGLLRALLNDCNAKPVASSSGVDVFREWRASFNYAIAAGKQDKIPMKYMMKEYKAWQESLGKQPSTKPQDDKDNNQPYKTFIQDEIDRHRMYTAGAIGSVFTYLLLSFKNNMFLQFTYFIQLMSDANGILVLLKFLTDKFSFGQIQPQEIYTKTVNFHHNFKCVLYTILQLLEMSCKNSPEKIKEYLLVYNGFLIFKKIPPLTGDDPLIESMVHSLLKMQLPYLSKKTKDSAANMKLVAEIYCKYPISTPPPPPREPLSFMDRMRLKNKMKLKPSKIISGFQDIKNAHLQFNNYHYWHVEKQKEKEEMESEKEDLLTRLQREVKIDKDFDHKKWLEENVYQMYD